MNPIDLTLFAEHSQKLPSRYLNILRDRKKTEIRNVILTHMVDFTIVMGIIVFACLAFTYSLDDIFVTRSLQKGLEKLAVLDLTGYVLPFVLFSYYFGCYFLNHGQSLGMYMIKRRLAMGTNSFKESAAWAAKSLMVSLTFGMSLLIEKDEWEKYNNHDYLYSELMAYKEDKSLCLLSLITESQADQESIEEVWNTAA